MYRTILTGTLLASVLLASGCACKHPWFTKSPAVAPCGPCGGAAPPPGAMAYPPPMMPAGPPAVPAPAVGQYGPTPDINGAPMMNQMPYRR